MIEEILKEAPFYTFWGFPFLVECYYILVGTQFYLEAGVFAQLISQLPVKTEDVTFLVFISYTKGFVL